MTNNFVLFNQQLCSIHPEYPLPLAQMAIPGHIKQTATARLEDQSRGNASLHAWRTATSIAEGHILSSQCRGNQPLRRGVDRIEDRHPMNSPPIREPRPARRRTAGVEKFLRLIEANPERKCQQPARKRGQDRQRCQKLFSVVFHGQKLPAGVGQIRSKPKEFFWGNALPTTIAVGDPPSPV